MGKANKKSPVASPPGHPVLKPVKINSFMSLFHYLHDHITYLNSSKFFAGIVMIMLNIGSKFISIQFSKSTEEYLKYSITKQLLVFAMAWMGTRCIYTAIMLTAAFVILSDHLFNEESHFCIVPQQYRVLHKLPDDTPKMSDQELTNAINILTKAQKEMKEKDKGSGSESGSGSGSVPAMAGMR